MRNTEIHTLSIITVYIYCSIMLSLLHKNCYINMGKKTLLRLFLFFLVLAFIFSTAAVPASRSFKEITETLWDQDSHYQTQAVVLDLPRNTVRILEEDESFIQGRMDMADYSGSGANNHHDPNPPGNS